MKKYIIEIYVIELKKLMEESFYRFLKSVILFLKVTIWPNLFIL